MMENHKQSDTALPTTENEATKTVEQRRPVQWKRFSIVSGLVTASLAAMTAIVYGYIYFTTPISVRQPLFEHYHFRLSLNVNNSEVNFADAKFQEGYSKDNCNVQLADHPFHFHDNKNHFVHVHWEGMTGGQLLKYYGWNFIGGTDDSLGYRFDKGWLPRRVPIAGNLLPSRSKDAQYYIYTGNADNYKQRDFKQFTMQDLEKFFGATSNSPAHELNKQKRGGLAGLLFPTAYAHGTVQEHARENVPEYERLVQINNLIGDAVIFVQKNPPTNAQIKDKFNDLTPLGESTCAG